METQAGRFKGADSLDGQQSLDSNAHPEEKQREYTILEVHAK